MNYLKGIFKHKMSRIWFAVSLSVIALFMVITILVETVLNAAVVSFLGSRPIKNFGGGIYYESGYKNKDDSFNKANELNERINEEGIVLLKNEKNVLPLKNVKNISVFGKNSVNLAYGGSGSGAFEVTDETPTIYQSLEKAGFKYNDVLKKFYENNGRSGNGRGKPPALDNGRSSLDGLITGETPIESYGKYKEIRESYKNFNDAALVVFTRIGGESFDLPRTMKVDGACDPNDHYLELDKNEQDLLVEVCANFTKVIVIINSSTQMELGFLDDINDNDASLVEGMQGISSKIDGALWIGGPGYSGILALGRVLNGTVTPSGKTIDTYQRDFTKDPTYQNFSDNLVNNGNMYIREDGKSSSVTEHFVDYEEGIYVGYRYYETRGFYEGEEWYKNNVVYSFGYGLSYADFEWTLKDMSFNEGDHLSWTGEKGKDQEFTVTVNIKNKSTSLYSGKEVVQVYITAPYDKVEKSHVVLVGFAKTSLLAPGKDEDVPVKFKGYDFASYDYENVAGGGYMLDSGKYEVKVMKNSHDVVASRSFTLDEAVSYANDPVTGTAVVNRYDDVSFEQNYGMESVLKRNGWDTTFPVNEVLKGSDKERTISVAFDEKIKSTETNNPIAKQEDVKMPDVADASSPAGTLELFRLIKFDENGEVERDEAGTILVDYEDENWDEYLNLLTGKEMMDFTMNGAFRTLALESIGLLPAFATDGPVGFVYFMAPSPELNPVKKTCSYASECVIAATWNVDLAYQMGESVGNEGVIGNERDNRPYTGWYAPAVNIHRTPFSGRNFEYYSEDPFISGKLAAQVIKGARSRGVYCQLKHFAVNDQETNRSGVCTWLTEQSLREIYLKPFEIAVKEGGAMGIMSSFNRIGSLWTGGDYRLLTEILREEWGFRGLVITDFNTESFMNTKQMCYAGGDLNLANTPKAWSPETAADYVVLRKAVKNILYTTARSNAMNGCGEGGYYITYYAWWEQMIIWLDIIIGVGAIVWGVFAVRNSVLRTKKEEAEGSSSEPESGSGPEPTADTVE